MASLRRPHLSYRTPLARGLEPAQGSTAEKDPDEIIDEALITSLKPASGKPSKEQQVAIDGIKKNAAQRPKRSRIAPWGSETKRDQELLQALAISSKRTVQELVAYMLKHGQVPTGSPEQTAAVAAPPAPVVGAPAGPPPVVPAPGAPGAAPGAAPAAVPGAAPRSPRKTVSQKTATAGQKRFTPQAPFPVPNPGDASETDSETQSSSDSGNTSTGTVVAGKTVRRGRPESEQESSSSSAGDGTESEGQSVLDVLLNGPEGPARGEVEATPPAKSPRKTPKTGPEQQTVVPAFKSGRNPRPRSKRGKYPEPTGSSGLGDGAGGAALALKADMKKRKREEAHNHEPLSGSGPQSKRKAGKKNASVKKYVLA